MVREGEREEERGRKTNKTKIFAPTETGRMSPNPDRRNEMSNQ